MECGGCVCVCVMGIEHLSEEERIAIRVFESYSCFRRSRKTAYSSLSSDLGHHMGQKKGKKEGKEGKESEK